MYNLKWLHAKWLYKYIYIRTWFSPAQLKIFTFWVFMEKFTNPRLRWDGNIPCKTQTISVPWRSRSSEQPKSTEEVKFLIKTLSRKQTNKTSRPKWLQWWILPNQFYINFPRKTKRRKSFPIYSVRPPLPWCQNQIKTLQKN